MRELCRNFQRGSCQYGDRCKFSHAAQQQQQRRPNNNNVNGFWGQSGSSQQQNTNPFGFGSQAGSQPQQQQQKTNPFGFGVQNNNLQSKGGPNSDFKQPQFKPFENKWSRNSSTSQNSASRQSDKSTQPLNHECTDPEACKRQIAEDFKQEKPLWILTCYGHAKGAPCDIVGDISYEELRATAYEDAKQGMSLQSIVEKERNILKSKLVEFEKLLSEPYKVPLNFSLDSQKHQPIANNANPFSTATQNNSPLSVSSFSQLGASMNMGFERSPVPQMNTQTNLFGSGGNNLASNTANLSVGGFSGAQSGGFSGAQSSPFGNGFSASGAQNNPFASGFSGAQNSPFGSGFSGVQNSPFGSGFSGAQSSPFSTTTFPSSTSQHSSIAFNDLSSTTLPQTSDAPLSSKSQGENVSRDLSIWLKEKWNPGEIPEEAPPDTVVR